MTEKIAKKVGEAYAFASVFQNTFNNNEEVMSELLGNHSESLVEITNKQQEDLHSIAENAGMAEIVIPKSEKTGEKITKMGEMYVGDDWDDVAEVLEWMSFFVGGAIVHWQLIAGAAEAVQDEDFSNVAKEGTEYYNEVMNQLRSYAIKVGQQRSEA